MTTTAVAPAPEAKKGELIVIRNSNDLRTQLQTHADKIFAAMPRHITPERMISICVRCFRKNPALARCNGLSILDSIAQAAALGLEPDGVLGHAYLVPYGDECVLIPGYKGLIDLCRRSGNVSEVHLECVYKGDQFSYSKGLEPKLFHVPDDNNPQSDDTQITHVYVVIRLRDGGVQFDVWPRARVEGHKQKYSQAWKRADGKKKDSPWHTNWKEMAMKTVLRNMVARGKVPVSAEIQRLAMNDELSERDYEAPPSHQGRVATSTLNSFLEAPEESEDADEPPDAEPSAQNPPHIQQPRETATKGRKGSKADETKTGEATGHQPERTPDGQVIPVDELAGVNPKGGTLIDNERIEPE